MTPVFHAERSKGRRVYASSAMTVFACFFTWGFYVICFRQERTLGSFLFCGPVWMVIIAVTYFVYRDNQHPTIVAVYTDRVVTEARQVVRDIHFSDIEKVQANRDELTTVFLITTQGKTIHLPYVDAGEELFTAVDTCFKRFRYGDPPPPPEKTKPERPKLY